MDKKKHKRVQPTNSSTNAETQNWQAKYNTLAGSVNFLLFNENEIMCDVTFIVGSEGNRIPAHKFILSARSNVFYNMFYGTSSSPETKEVPVPDVEPSAFRNLLKYLYTNKDETNQQTLFTTCCAASKYDVSGLVKRCLKKENAFLFLKQARENAPHLISACLNMIDKETHACLDAECFLDIDYDTLEFVVGRDTLRVKEISLYEAVMRWSVAECERHGLPVDSENQRMVLKECIRLIRYPLMSGQEFAQGPARCGLLTPIEVNNVYAYINTNGKLDCDFPNEPRSAASEPRNKRLKGAGTVPNRNHSISVSSESSSSSGE